MVFDYLPRERRTLPPAPLTLKLSYPGDEPRGWNAWWAETAKPNGRVAKKM
jgi:hypothetical protein